MKRRPRDETVGDHATRLAAPPGGVAAAALAGGDPARAVPTQSNAAIIAAGTLRQPSGDIDILSRAPSTAYASPSILGAREAPQCE
ncbi:hypothetical protein M2283_008399 [Streptomyces pseudovenezuelae]|uniref:Uncharacterized protein n=1 Tax=Streptomyces pseudovenezuelae TaxID=67350 RepID=A0ABT6LXN1_9ACTN|nr:hypothetical protein [Streptomyces pseudovenezuelae]